MTARNQNDPVVETAAAFTSFEQMAAAGSPDAVDAQIAVIINRAASLATVDVNQAWAEIDGRLRVLYDQAVNAGDADAQTHIAVAYEQAQAVAANAQATGETAAAALAALAQVKRQRDTAISDVEELEYQMEVMEETIVEQVYESLWGNGGIIWQDPGNDLIESLINAPGIAEAECPTQRLADKFMYSLTSADELTEAEARELIAFIVDFAGRVDARQTAESEAMHAYWKAQREQLLLQAGQGGGQ